MLRTAARFLVVLLALASQAALRADPMKPVYLDSKATDPPAGETASGEATKPALPLTAAMPPLPPLEVDPQKGLVTLAGKFTGSQGTIELGACAKGGKTHLAALVLEVRPSRIAEAMAEIGVAAGEVPVADREAGTATLPKGRKVLLFVQWHAREKDGVVLRRARLEHLFWNQADERVLGDAAWIYAGSKMIRDEVAGDGLMAANVSGSVATIERLDTSALFYYGGDLGAMAAWSAHAKLLPAAGTPCRLIVEPVPEEKAAAQEHPVERAVPAKSEAEAPAGTASPDSPSPVEIRVPESIPAPAPVIDKLPDEFPPAPAVEGQPGYGERDASSEVPPLPASPQEPDRSVP